MIFSLIAREGRTSLAPAIIGVIIAAAFTITHTVLYIHYKSWYFYLMVLAALLQSVSFSTRLGWILDQAHNGPLYVSFLIAVVTPSLIMAPCHLTFGRILSYTKSLPKNLKIFLIPARIITPMFVGLDIAALCFQLLGGSMIVAAYETAADPENPVMHVLHLGLLINKWTSVVQTIYLGIFAILALQFLLLAHLWDLKRSHLYVGALTMGTSVSSTLIMLQQINSIIEIDATLNNFQAYSTEHEWVFWVVDALPIFLVFLAFAVVHPGLCLPPMYTRICRRGSSESKRPPKRRPKTTDIVYQPHSPPSTGEMINSPFPLPPGGAHPNPSSESGRFGEMGNTTTVTPGTFRNDLWPWGPARPLYHEVSPYESDHSYEAYMRGAL